MKKVSYAEKKQAFFDFTTRMELVTEKTRAVSNGDYRAAESELVKLKKDFQKFAKKCDDHDQGVFLFSQILYKFEDIFNKNTHNLNQ